LHKSKRIVKADRDSLRTKGPNLKKGHLLVGVIGLIIFVLTGQYMHWHFNHLQGMADGPRLMYRTAHIYILWVALLNLVLGLYVQPLENKIRRRIQQAGSLAIMISAVFVSISFFTDSENVTFWRGWARMGIYLALAGSVFNSTAVAKRLWRD
jgi:nitric oxide reductase large subunit